MLRKGLLLATAVLTLSGFYPTELWHQRNVRVQAFEVTKDSQLRPIRGRTVLIWLDKPAFRSKLNGVTAAEASASGEVSKIRAMIRQLGKANYLYSTDENGEVFFKVYLQQKALILVVDSDSVYVGTKQSGLQRADCRKAGSSGLARELGQF